MEAAFCVETLEDALARHGKPEIFNTDQGSQFAGAAFTGALIKDGIAISMDGKGAWCVNIFVERVWRQERNIKYEEVYLCEATTASQRQRGLRLINQSRHPIGRSSLLHPAATPLGSLTPAEALLIDAEKTVQTAGAASNCRVRTMRCRK